MYDGKNVMVDEMKKELTIAYGFSNCSDKIYKDLLGRKSKFVMVTDQKYHKLLQKGLQHQGAKVYCYSGLPINRDVTKKIIINVDDDKEDDIYYHYYPTINLPIIRQLMVFCLGFINILFSRRKYDCLICDYMSIMNSFGMALAAKLRKIPVIEIVMDLPGLMNTTGSPVKGIHKLLSGLATGFVFLTEHMSKVVNWKEKPYIVMEGHIDNSVTEVPIEEKWEIKNQKKIIIYAGGIHRVFGVENLVKGFIQADIRDSELRIFGDGDYREELVKLCKNNPKVRYMGVLNNEEIVYQEQRAALLVNPRPSSPIYTRYSFPSKNMEYMASGTPVLTTNLPGMPEEYKDHVYLIEDETVCGIAKALNDVLLNSFSTRNNRGKATQLFVKEHKTNNVQAQRLIRFINEIISLG